MIDPLPLTQDGATPFETLLLSAGRSDALSSHGRARIHFGLGLGGGALATSAIASSLKATAATAAKSALLSSGSAAVVGAVGAVALLFGAQRFLAPPAADLEARSPRPVVVEARQVVPARPLQIVAPAPAQPIAEAIEPKLAVTKPNARSAAGGAIAGASLANELNAIEDARRAMARREYSLGLRLLDDYAQRFPQQSLRSEATLLRIETLAASGSTDAAHQLGKSFLANHPNGPYARRVRSLLSDSVPATKNER